MPILLAEPATYPEDLWEGGATSGGDDHRWWCLHARPRQEKAAARHLRSLGICHYLPQVIQEGRTPGGRKIASLIPLFPGYLFLLGEDRHRVEAMKGNHLVGVLDVADQTGLERDLLQIHRMLSSGLPVMADPTHPVGARIRITCGPLQGLVGTVVRRQGQGHRFVAVVAFLNRGASVELKDWEAELIDPTPVSFEGPRPRREMHAGRPAAAHEDRSRPGGRPPGPPASPA